MNIIQIVDGVEKKTSGGSGDVAGDSASIDKEFVRFNSTTGKAIESPNTDVNTTTATLSDNADVTFYDATNDGNPVFSFGASATEKLTITSFFASGTQTLEYVEFDTKSADATADYGEYRFSVDEALVCTIDDGGVEIKASGALSFGAVDILTDSSGTTTLNNIDAIDATTESTIENAIDTLSNLTAVGALNAGSITNGFGSIDVGADNITTTGILGASGAALANGVTATTQSANDNSTKVATTAYVDNAVSGAGGGVTVTAKTGNYSIQASDCSGNTIFTNTGAGGAIEFSLPAGADNYKVSFYITVAEYLKITADGTETIRYNATQGAAGGYIRENTIGRYISFLWNGVEWGVVEMIGTWLYDE